MSRHAPHAVAFLIIRALKSRLMAFSSSSSSPAADRARTSLVVAVVPGGLQSGEHRGIEQTSRFLGGPQGQAGECRERPGIGVQQPACELTRESSLSGRNLEKRASSRSNTRVDGGGGSRICAGFGGGGRDQLHAGAHGFERATKRIHLLHLPQHAWVPHDVARVGRPGPARTGRVPRRWWRPRMRPTSCR